MSFSLGYKGVIQDYKANKGRWLLIAFAILTLADVLVCVLAFDEPVVPVCLLVLLECVMASKLLGTEIWIHGIVVVIQLIVGILADRTALTILLLVIYLLAVGTLMLKRIGDKKDGKR